MDAGAGWPASEEIAVAALVSCTMAGPLRHRARLDVPDVSRVLGDRAVARELPGAGYVQDCPTRPSVRVRIEPAELRVGLEIGNEIREMHVVVAAREQGVA